MSKWTYSTASGFTEDGTGRVIVPTEKFTCSWLPDGQNTKVMSVGDSITLGLGGESHGGYRMLLYRMLSDAGFSFTPRGWNTAPPNLPYATDYLHKGTGYSAYGGWTMKSLMNQAANNATGVGNTPGTSIATWITNYDPAFLILMIGTNDTGTPADWAADMSALATMIFNAKPSIKILWGPILYQNNLAWGTCDQVNAAWRTEWDKWRAQGKSIVEAPTQSYVGTAPKNFNDLIHPSTYGYEAIARAYFDTLVTL